MSPMQRRQCSVARDRDHRQLSGPIPSVNFGSINYQGRNSKCVHALKFPYSSGLPFDLNMVPVCATFLVVVIDRLLRGGGGANMC